MSQSKLSEPHLKPQIEGEGADTSKGEADFAQWWQ